MSTLYESADQALEIFRTFKGQSVDLVKTGISTFDRVVGGMFRGSCGVLGMNQGAGKSSLMLTAAMTTRHKTAIISLEDGPDVLGSRALSYVSGVDSLRMRRGELADFEVEALRRGRADLQERADHIRVYYAVGGTMEMIEAAIDEAAQEGCEIAWLDYLQKVRGLNRNDRRNEVSEVYTTFQRRCADTGMVGMVISQFSRQEPGTEPRTWWLKESGDIENEARIILLGWPAENRRVKVRIAKSTYGGEGILFEYQRDNSGSLREVDTFLPDDLGGF